MMMKHCLNIDHLNKNDIEALFQSAKTFSSKSTNDSLPITHDIGLCFWENSTRTRVSFELAAKRLNQRPLYMYAKQSSAEKGESLLDTLLTLYATGIKCFVIRHPQAQYYEGLVEALPQDVSLINAGDGHYGHPSQALLDAFTMLQHVKTLFGLKVLFVGDVAHSRVVRSNVRLLTKMQAHCSAYVPEHLKSKTKDIQGLEYVNNFNQALAECDVVMMLRSQDERWSGELKSSHDDQKHSYLERYGLNQERLKYLKNNALIMHPGPFRRGVEIDDHVLNDSRCVIWQQVENGVYMRMALFNALLGGNEL